MVALVLNDGSIRPMSELKAGDCLLSDNGLPCRITKVTPIQTNRAYKIIGHGLTQIIVHEHQHVAVYNKNTSRTEKIAIVNFNPSIHLGFSRKWSPFLLDIISDDASSSSSSYYLRGVRMDCFDPLSKINSNPKWKENVLAVCGNALVPTEFSFPDKYRVMSRDKLHQLLAGIADGKNGCLVSEQHYTDLLSLCALLGIHYQGYRSLGSFQANGETYSIDSPTVRIHPDHVYSVEKNRIWGGIGCESPVFPITEPICTFPIELVEIKDPTLVHTIQIEPVGCVISHTGMSISLQ